MSSELSLAGAGAGLADVYRRRYLLRLLVAKELTVRYRGSILGILWSYVKPGIQFGVFYFALGIFLGQSKGTENYAVYLFSGIILINFFTEALSNASRSMVANGGLIKKIYLPRELFPVASVWVAAVHFFPQLLVLLIACVFTGWQPNMLQILVAIPAFLLVALLAIGLGLLFGAANVYFRDAENLVDLLLMVATWASPVLYSWTQVRAALGPTLTFVYQMNPITIAVEAFHYAFWFPTTDGTAELPPNLLTIWLPAGLVVGLLTVVAGQLTFRRLEGRFAQEL
ncbi:MULTISPECIES: ABC transporter permease [unclassified Arthrobacter]|uniref:ABC transporter permease n=1 Tax=unclassified Arthrobacter TaxID=235627 RepID=UPI001CFFF2A6|nr:MULTISPECIES: ABC transporter permease [unclassified Arthrobacter]MCB5283206.1 Teichoic acid translocation permease protein TagG [Arthrobacter sp. ES1]WGZ78447.1 ABC transporter permease [Arthrobacter sp. EM1]